MSRRKAPPDPIRALRPGSPGFALPGADRIRLLEEIDSLGSITKAARAAGMSYKTAWDIVDSLDSLFERPLVRRTAGGRGGGGTVLTEEGREVARRFRIIEREHLRSMESLSAIGAGLSIRSRAPGGNPLKLSTRNILPGRVAQIRRSAVSARVTLSLGGGDALDAVVTNRSVEELGLAPGTEAKALIKASAIVLGKNLHGTRTGARNVLCGTVTQVVHGCGHGLVTAALAGGDTLTAVVAEGTGRRLRFREGDHACAVVPPSGVVLGVDG